MQGSTQPILVTGMPRSGTTWLARFLATASGTGLAGREPMNPRGRQYGLGGTLDGWAALTEPSTRQRRALWTAYHGVNPLVLSRYGRRQWAAPLPWTRVVIKDPFALLSIPAVVEVTGAQPVVLFRHPGASLVSYRRMGWTADLDELAPLLAAHRQARGLPSDPQPGLGQGDEVADLAAFWSGLYEIALDTTEGLPVTWVSHEALSTGGAEAGRRLFDRLGLTWTAESERTFGGPASSAEQSNGQSDGQLHHLDRDPSSVAEAWRARLADDELSRIEELTAPVRARLAATLD